MSGNGPPDYGMPIPALFLSDSEEKTFQYDKTLPSLPVPALDETLAKYLKSVKPFLTDEEFAETQKTVKDFQNGIGKELHQKLMEKSKHMKNWLEKWWEDYAYLSLRMPHAPYVNFGGPAPYSRVMWPPKTGTQIERAAMLSWFMLKFWEILRKERLRVDRGGKTNVWSMHQFYRMFSGCKTPGENIDRLNDYFRTESEGDAASHLLVICRGRYFTIKVLDKDRDIITVPEFEVQFRRIRSLCDGEPEGPGVGALTGQNRTVWYQLREHLISIHPENAKHLDVVQKAIFVVALDDLAPVSDSEIGREALVGNPRLRWFDKSMTLIVFRNGMTASNCDHAPHDAMVNVVLSYFVYLGLDACNYSWTGPKSIRSLPAPTELSFRLDDRIIKGINDADQFYRESNNSMDIKIDPFTCYGRDLLRIHNVHPDAFVQMALQLAYFRLHQKPAPTYETASTRRFYNGRTETLRSCTTETLNWSKSMLDASASNAKRRQLFNTAVETHLRNMTEAQENQGCDRHLFGLQICALENGIPIPKLYADPAYTKSGGGGNYILSTSCIGYTPVIGGVAPMCTNGYGVFYSIEPDRINIFVISWIADQETSSCKLYNSISESLLDTRRMLEGSASARL